MRNFLPRAPRILLGAVATITVFMVGYFATTSESLAGPTWELILLGVTGYFLAGAATRLPSLRAEQVGLAVQAGFAVFVTGLAVGITGPAFALLFTGFLALMSVPVTVPFLRTLRIRGPLRLFGAGGLWPILLLIPFGGAIVLALLWLTVNLTVFAVLIVGGAVLLTTLLGLLAVRVRNLCGARSFRETVSFAGQLLVMFGVTLALFAFWLELFFVMNRGG